MRLAEFVLTSGERMAFSPDKITLAEYEPVKTRVIEGAIEGGNEWYVQGRYKECVNVVNDALNWVPTLYSVANMDVFGNEIAKEAPVQKWDASDSDVIDDIKRGKKLIKKDCSLKTAVQKWMDAVERVHNLRLEVDKYTRPVTAEDVKIGATILYLNKKEFCKIRSVQFPPKKGWFMANERGLYIEGACIEFAYVEAPDED